MAHEAGRDVRSTVGVALSAIVLAGALGVGCGGGDDPGAGLPGAGNGGAGGGTAQAGTGPNANARAGGGLDNGASTGTTRWSGRVGGALGDVAHNAAADAHGNVYVAGTFDGTAEVAGVPMTSAGMLDVFVAKYTPSGQAAWVRHFGGAGIDMVSGLTVDVNDNVWFTGTSSADISLGGPTLNATGGAGIFLGRLDAFGNHLGSAAFGGAAIGTTTLVNVDAGGNIILAGTYQSSITFGTTVLPEAAGSYDLFVTKFDPQGAVVFARALGGSGVDSMQGLALDSAGNIVIAGSFTGTADFGTGPLQSLGSLDAFVATIGAAGTTLYAARFGGLESDIARGVAVDAQGNVLVAGTFGASVDFGGGPTKSNGNGDLFVTKRTPSLTHTWTKTYGGAGEDQAMAVANDSAGNVVVAGFFEGAMQVGATPFRSEGERDAFVLKIGPTGQNLFSKHFGAKEDDEAAAIAVDGFGRVIVGGSFRTSVDFGAGSQTSAGESDVFLATFDP